MRRGEDHARIRWKLHLERPPAAVYAALATDEGRATFWAERTVASQGTVRFEFPGGQATESKILAEEPPERFELVYFGTRTRFDLEPDGQGGTDLTLDAWIPDEGLRKQMAPGWVSVLLALKAAVDHGIDLRNHDPDRSWTQGYVDN
ncbi:MAG: hypothetical protein R3185_06200 [Candidatus Thermoplasmatota archaeon]|nr:hypothetical protein [Candidatus Thermoplasmatota archaeon]